MKFGLVVPVVVLAMSSVAVASASASEFVFSKTGTVKEKMKSGLEFHTEAGIWECTQETSSGEVPTLKSATLKTTVQYDGCKLLGHTVTASPAEYEFNAGTTPGTGTVSILKPLQFTIKLEGEVECTMSFPAQKSLGSIEYVNKSGEIELVYKIIDIESTGTGSFCDYPTEKAGTVTDVSLMSLESGTLEWVE